jgi:putrescine aminotransferase
MTMPMALPTPPTPRTLADWQDADRRHHLHPFTDHQELAAEGALVIDSAQGVWLTDVAGKRYLDGMAGLWCVNVGYGRAELADAAAEQMRRLPFYNTFFKTTTPRAIELAEAIATRTPEGLDHVFFANSGSEANDTNIRLVQTYWQQRGQPQRTQIISRERSYHGSTIAGASLTGLASMHDIPAIPIPGISHILPPHWYAHGGAEDPEAFGLRAANALEARILELGPGRVAAFFAEPVMGAGGVVPPPASYWPRVQAICQQHDVLLVIDEVICGFGRTGEWFGCQTYGIAPDLMTVAKGLSSGYQPIAASVVGTRVAEALFERPGRFPHGYTYSGHPVAAAVALENLRILERERLVERVRDDIGPYFLQRLATLASHPMVGQTRGVGLMACVELTSDKATRAGFEPAGSVSTLVRNRCFANGLVTRAVFEGLVFAPPFTITHEEVDTLVATLGRCIDEVWRSLPR